MLEDNETVEEIAKRVRRECGSLPLPTAATEKLKLVREFQAAHERELAAKIAQLRKHYQDMISKLVGKPRRNCDRFAAESEASEEYVRAVMEDGIEDGRYCEWLFDKFEEGVNHETK